jgi:hypothetical protein
LNWRICNHLNILIKNAIDNKPEFGLNGNLTNKTIILFLEQRKGKMYASTWILNINNTF